MAVKIGLSQRKNPTPTWLGFAVQIVYDLSSAISMYVVAAPKEIVSTPVAMKIVFICGLIALISGRLKNFIGVVTPKTDIPIENVTEMTDTSTSFSKPAAPNDEQLKNE